MTIKVCDEQTLPPCYHFLPLRSFLWILSISSNYLNDTNCDFYSPWNIIFIFDQDSSKTLYYENQSVCSITWLCASKSWHFKVYSISHGRTESSIGSFGRHVLIDVLNWKNRIIPSKLLFVSLTKYFLNFTTSSHLSQFQIDRVMFATFSLDHSSFHLYLFF